MEKKREEGESQRLDSTVTGGMQGSNSIPFVFSFSFLCIDPAFFAVSSFFSFLLPLPVPFVFFTLVPVADACSAGSLALNLGDSKEKKKGEEGREARRKSYYL